MTFAGRRRQGTLHKRIALISVVVLSMAVVPTASAAAPDSNKGQLPAGATISLYLDCSTVPATPQAAAALRRYHVCGGGGGDMTPMSTVSSNCGDLSLDVGNGGGGLLVWRGRVTSKLGPFTSGSYVGSWSNITNGRRGPVNRSYFGFTSAWSDTFRIGTGSGSVFGTIAVALVQLWWGPFCGSTIPVDSHATVT